MNENLLEGTLISYVLAQEDLEEKLKELQLFLHAKNIELDLETLRKQVHKVKREIERPKKEAEFIAELFNKDKEARKYRYGSAFCPKCEIFKNYEKECPYCRYLEMEM